MGEYSIRDAISFWGDELRRLERTDRHIRRSVRSVERFVVFTEASTLADLKPLHLLQWVTSKGWTGKTAMNMAGYIRAWGAWMDGVDLLTPNPWRRWKQPRLPRPNGATPFTLDELRRLIEATRLREASYDGRRNRFGPLRSTLYITLVSTGLRIGEATSQRWEDIDLARGLMRVTRDKSRRGDLIPLSQECVAVLCHWSHWSQGDKLFPNRPHDYTVHDDFTAAGIDSGRGTWHRFRKSAVTLRARNWSDYREVVRFARHVDPRLTMELYDEVLAEELRPVTEAIPKFFSDHG